ncbi:MAG: phosphodiesterase [Pseudomonadota bacterium]
MKIVWLSDLHLTLGGQDLLGVDPERRLVMAIDRINRDHADAAYCVLTGDLVEAGNEESYRVLKKHLDRLSVPYLPLVGNHDERASFLATLPLPDLVLEGFVQYRVKTPQGWIICLDTLMPGQSAGVLCKERLTWLRDALIDVGDESVYLFMHHPPGPIGSPMQDGEGLTNGDDLLALLADYSSIRHLFVGHVHRPISGSFGPVPFTAMRSAAYQAPPPYPPWTWETFQPANEPPAMGVILIDGGNTVVHFCQFGEEEKAAQ